MEIEALNQALDIGAGMVVGREAMEPALHVRACPCLRFHDFSPCVVGPDGSMVINIPYGDGSSPHDSPHNLSAGKPYVQKLGNQRHHAISGPFAAEGIGGAGAVDTMGRQAQNPLVTCILFRPIHEYLCA
jgi:hypothetical protein